MLLRMIGILTALLLMTQNASSEDTIEFALDWKFEGPAAPFFVAIDRGYFADRGLEVNITAGSGSTSAIPKVATGSFPLGFADINVLVKFLDQNPGAPVTAIMMIYDKPPLAVIGRKSLGVSAPADLEGRVLGAPAADAAWAQFNAFTAAAGVDFSAVKVETVGFPTREPMLAEGKVDAVAGYSFSSFFNLIRLGIPEDDIAIILMADHGLELYGNAIIVNTDFAAANPEIVEHFLAAVAAGYRDVIVDPKIGIEALLPRNPAMDESLERRRLAMVIEQNVVTDYTIENGLGGIDPDRMARAFKQLSEGYSFRISPNMDRVFDSSYLPVGNFKIR